MYKILFKSCSFNFLEYNVNVLGSFDDLNVALSTCLNLCKDKDVYGLDFPCPCDGAEEAPYGLFQFQVSNGRTTEEFVGTEPLFKTPVFYVS